MGDEKKKWETHDLAPAGTSSHPLEFGRYRDLTLIGQGAMGRVYRAYDPVLDRSVAVKLLRGEDPELQKRLLLEAKAQSRIEHDNVCHVYEAGEVDGKPYIAMQFIRGKNLSEISPQLTQEQKVRIVATVCEAVHAAHRLGLIHRDIKPANILVEEDEDGQMTPYIMDFGLAREVKESGLTATGQILGTPWYMSPEQARGDLRSLDRRTDVYSLGVTLYEVLSGRYPIDGDNAIEVLVHVVHKDPVPLRQYVPHVPADLETVVMKALEKDQTRRYDSAKALQNDLLRFLEGEPVLAMPPGWLYLLKKKARRNKAVVTSSAIALILVLLVSFLGLRARWMAQRQAAAAQQFGETVKEIEAILRYAYMSPLHDVRKERQQVTLRMEQIESRMRDLGKAALGPGNYALGRGSLALGKYETARERLQVAWDSGYRNTDTATSLGLAVGELYREKLRELEQIPAGTRRENRRKEIERDYRDPALSLLREGETGTTEAGTYVQAVLAFYENHRDEALRLSRQAREQVPWLYEAVLLQGDILQSHAREDRMHGRYDQAFLNFKEAIRLYEESENMARSDPRILERQCEVWGLVANLRNEFRNEMLEYYEKAVRSCEKALAADPYSSTVFDRMSYAHSTRADYNFYRGEDPTVFYRKSIEAAEQAVRLNPRFDSAYRNIGYGYLGLAEYAAQNGAPSDEDFTRSIESYRKANSISPNGTAYHNIGYACYMLSSNAQRAGADPRPLIRQSIESHEKAMTLLPDAEPVASAAEGYLQLGIYDLEHGGDPRPDFQKAESLYRKALEINPQNDVCLWGLGTLYRSLGRFQMLRGGNPGADYGKAAEYFRNLVSIKSDMDLAQRSIGEISLDSAEYELMQGRDAAVRIKEALGSLQQAVRLNPSIDENHRELARAFLLRARQDRASGQSPLQDLDSSTQSAYNALRLRTTNGSWNLAARAALDQARWAMQRSQSPEPAMAKARHALDESLKLDPHHAETCLLAAQYSLRLLEWKRSRGPFDAQEMQEGIRMVEKGLEIHPALFELHAIRGALLLQQARATGDRQLAQQAFEALSDSLKRNAHLTHEYNPYLREARELASSNP